MSSVHDEGKDIMLMIAFLDDHHQPVTPVSAEYRVTKGDGTELIPWTTIAGLAQSVEVIVPASYNLITNETTNWEERHAAVRFHYGPSSKAGSAGVQYRIRNLKALV